MVAKKQSAMMINSIPSSRRRTRIRAQLAQIVQYAATCLRSALPADHGGDFRVLHELGVVAAPRRRAILRRQQSVLFGQDHPGETPPVGDDIAGAVIDEIVAVLGRKSARALPGEAVEPGVILRG